MKKIFNLAVIFAALMTAVSFSSCADEDKAEEEANEQALESIDVEVGGKYTFSNADNEKSGYFKVISAEGKAGSKVVEIEIITKKDANKGETYILGDDADHTSYLMLDGEKFVNVKQADAVANASKVIFCLASANDTYTITSATVNAKVNAAGATKTLFAIKK